MNLSSARKAAEFVGIASVDATGRPICAIVPGHKGNQYKVSLARTKERIIILECFNLNETEVCKGFQHNGICFHSLAVLIYSAQEKNVKLKFCKTIEGARLIQKLGGTIIEVTSKSNLNKSVFVVGS